METFRNGFLLGKEGDALRLEGIDPFCKKGKTG